MLYVLLMNRKPEVILILDNIRSVYNVASIFRTADCVGVKEILLCGVTPTPIDRFGRKRKDFHKVSLGAEGSVVWKYFKDTREVVTKMKANKIKVMAVEQSAKSTDYRKIKLPICVALILGPEVTGISQGILKECDEILEIPMMGDKESLNVSTTAGAVLFSQQFFPL